MADKGDNLPAIGEVARTEEDRRIDTAEETKIVGTTIVEDEHVLQSPERRGHLRETRELEENGDVCSPRPNKRVQYKKGFYKKYTESTIHRRRMN